MQFTMEDVKKLTEKVMAGDADEIPEIEPVDTDTFIRYFTAMGMYMVSISKYMETINKRLETIELDLLDKAESASA
jgi:hypothetical protein